MQHDCMTRSTIQIAVRGDDKLERAIAALRRNGDSINIPTISDIVRQAVMEKFERDLGTSRKTMS